MFNYLSKKESRDLCKEINFKREDLETNLDVHRITNYNEVVNLISDRVMKYGYLVETHGYFFNPDYNDGTLNCLAFPLLPFIGVPYADKLLRGKLEDGNYGPIFAVDNNNKLGLAFCPWQTYPTMNIISERMIFIPKEKLVLGGHKFVDFMPEKVIDIFFTGKCSSSINEDDIIALINEEGVKHKLEVLIDYGKLKTSKVTILKIPLKFSGIGTATRCTDNNSFLIKVFDNNKAFYDSFPYLGEVHNHRELKSIECLNTAENRVLLINHFGEKEYMRLNSIGDVLSIFSSKDCVTQTTKNYLGEEKSARIPISMVMAFGEDGEYWGSSVFDVYLAKKHFGFQRVKNIMLLAQELKQQDKTDGLKRKDLIKFYEEIRTLSIIDMLPESIGTKL